MNKIISNSSPIIALSMIEQLPLLNELFDQVYIPMEVYREIALSDSEQKMGQLELKQAVQEKRISVYSVQNHSLVNKLKGRLHRGELEVIVGAKELDLNFVLIDERAARRVAETFLLSPLGTVGLLILAKKRGKLKKIKDPIHFLIDQGFRMDKKLYQQVLTEAEEY